MTKKAELETISGELKIGEIDEKTYGYDIANLIYTERDITSRFIPDQIMDSLGVWSNSLSVWSDWSEDCPTYDSLYFHFKGFDDPTIYPNYLKLYINGALAYVGKLTDLRLDYDFVGFEYASEPPGKYSALTFFSEQDKGKSYDIKIEFYDELNVIKNSQFRTITGKLTVGEIHEDSYGYDIANKGYAESDFTCEFIPHKIMGTLGCWSRYGLLYFHFWSHNEPAKYPQFLKLYVDDELAFVGEFSWYFMYRGFEYESVPPGKYSAKTIFCKKNEGKTFKIRLEFYDEL